jgi:hypothetical protein
MLAAAKCSCHTGLLISRDFSVVPKTNSTNPITANAKPSRESVVYYSIAQR